MDENRVREIVEAVFTEIYIECMRATLELALGNLGRVSPDTAEKIAMAYGDSIDRVHERFRAGYYDDLEPGEDCRIV